MAGKPPDQIVMVSIAKPHHGSKARADADFVDFVHLGTFEVAKTYAIERKIAS